MQLYRREMSLDLMDWLSLELRSEEEEKARCAVEVAIGAVGVAGRTVVAAGVG